VTRVLQEKRYRLLPARRLDPQFTQSVLIRSRKKQKWREPSRTIHVDGPPMKTHLGSAIVLATLAGLTYAPATAAADHVSGTRSEKLVEKSHKIDIQIGHGYADLRVRRTVHNGGSRHDQAMFHIDLPYGAVAVGLRTLGMKDGAPHWFDGELLEAEAAAARYRELTGIGGYYPKDPALLSWRSQTHLALQVFPCPPNLDKTVEYTLRIPTEYREGRHHLKLPRIGTESLAAEATVTPVVSGESIYVDDKPMAAPGWVNLKQEVDIAVAPNTKSPVDGALASIPVNAQKNIMHYHIDAAPRVGTVPPGAFVVVLVDASFSLSENEVQAELTMARSFVGHFPAGRIAIMPFNRKVNQPAGFVSVGQALSTFKTMVIDRRNGSDVDSALAQADALLTKAPTGSARRILLLTDTRTRAEITPEFLKQKLAKSGALLHVGVVRSAGKSWLERDDEHPWNTVTRPSGGLVWNAGTDEYTPNDANNFTLFEEWARPKRIHHFALHAPSLNNKRFSAPDILDEGQGIEELDLPANAVDKLEVTGELWATSIRREFVRNDAENQRWAGLFFGTTSYSAITEEEMMPIAMLGKAVSPVTSYLAIEPGVRPSTEGLEEFEGVGIGFGSGFGRASDRLFGARRVKYPDDKETFLRRMLEAGLAKCSGGTHKANVALETTRAEIVAVKSSVEGEPPTSTLSTCFEESVWEIALRGDFISEYEVFTITL
jgi:hypothetical protein